MLKIHIKTPVIVRGVHLTYNKFIRRVKYEKNDHTNSNYYLCINNILYSNNNIIDGIT